MMHRVLITGAGGGIGRSLRETLRGVYPVLRLSDRVPLMPAREGEEVDRTDIADMAAVERMVAGVDGIIHLGGISGESSWENILHGNIIGLYNVFEAARRAGVQRIVMATSNHAVGFYPRSQTIDHRVVPRPDSRYGVSNNRRSWYDNSNAYRLGYQPQDDSEPYAAEILAAEAGQPKDPIAERYQGGTFCADEFTAATPPE